MLTVDIDSNSGFCAGVIRAIGKAEEFLKEHSGNGKNLYSLGAIVHNDAELSRLVSQGLVTIDKEDLEEMLHEDHGCEVKCEYCNTVYQFDEHDLNVILGFKAACGR